MPLVIEPLNRAARAGSVDAYPVTSASRNDHIVDHPERMARRVEHAATSFGDNTVIATNLGLDVIYRTHGGAQSSVI